MKKQDIRVNSCSTDPSETLGVSAAMRSFEDEELCQ